MFGQKCLSVFQAVHRNLCFRRHSDAFAFQIAGVMTAVVKKYYVVGKKKILHTLLIKLICSMDIN